MQDAVQIELIVAVGVIVTALASGLSPIVLARINNRQRSRERAEDFARQDAVAARIDEVAAQAATAARLLHTAQQDASQRTAEVAVAAAANAAETRTQLKQIHTLVNSDMTAARQGELDQMIVSLALMRRVVVLDQGAGRAPNADDLSTIEQTEKRIVELRAMLADRLVQMKLVEQEQADAKMRV